MRIAIMDHGKEPVYVSPEQMAAAAPQHFLLSERVPGIEGDAFDLKTWYESWTEHNQSAPTHLLVEAADEFQATIPWSQLDTAALLYAVNGQPLRKGYPIRLYVPDGSSQCLNVKSIVTFSFLRDESLSLEAEYGFKNSISPEQLKKGL